MTFRRAGGAEVARIVDAISIENDTKAADEALKRQGDDMARRAHDASVWDPGDTTGRGPSVI
jgi:hypothetical protein